MKQNEIITRSKREKQKQSDERLLLVPVIRDNNNNDESNENESDITKIAAAGLIAIGIVEKLKPMIQISCNIDWCFETLHIDVKNKVKTD